MRISACCKRGEPPPPPGLPIPLGPSGREPLGGRPLGFADCSEFAAEPALTGVGTVDGAPDEVPFRRTAIRCAIGGGSLRKCDSAVILTRIGFFETTSWTVIVPADTSSAGIFPAKF